MAKRPLTFDFDLEGEPILPSGREHTCSVCGTVGAWSSSWSWYGSYCELDDDVPVLKFCSGVCADKMPVVAAAKAKAEADAWGDQVASAVAEIDGEEAELRERIKALKKQKRELLRPPIEPSQ